MRVQRALRKRADQGSAILEQMESDYGGIESWADDIMNQSQWIRQSVYSEFHSSDDEGSYNLHRTIEGLNNISSAVGGLAAHVTGVTKILYKTARQDESLSSLSLRFSVFGLMFLILGLSLQICGMWPEGELQRVNPLIYP